MDTVSVNGTTLSASSRAIPRPVRVALLVAVVTAIITLLMPTVARADWIDDAVSGLLEPMVQDSVNNISEAFSTISADQLFTADFEHLLGDQTNAIYSMVQNISRYTIFPVACVMLSLSILMQLLKISQHMDSTGTLPGLKEVAGLFVWCAICMYVLSHSFGLARDFYAIFNGFSEQISPSSQSVRFVVDLSGTAAGEAAGTAIGMAFTNLVLSLVSLVVAAITKLMFYARAVQIYLYAIFAPLMLAMLGFDELKHWSMGYVKGFLAACLSGFIMVFAMAAFPYILTIGFAGNYTMDGTTMVYTVTSGNSTTWVISVLAAGLCLGLLMIKSGTYAREILGG